MLKTCNKCLTSKPSEEFHKDRFKKDGLCGKCKECNKSSAKKWYSDNSELGRKTRAEHYKNNKESHLATCKAYRDRNLEECRARSRNYRRDNREKRQEYDKLWQAKNPDKVKRYKVANAATRRAAKLASHGSYTAQQIVDLLEKQKGKCICCLKSIKTRYHVDHIYPLKGYPGTRFRPKIRLWNEVRPTQHRTGTLRCASPTRPT